MEWLWTHPLGIAISSGIAVAALVGIGRLGVGWWKKRRDPGLSFAGITQHDLLRKTLDQMTYAKTSIEQVWRSSSAGPLLAKADAAAEQVQALAYQLRDSDARNLVHVWKAAYDSAPHGEGQGATDQATIMRDAYRDAAEKLGELLR